MNSNKLGSVDSDLYLHSCCLLQSKPRRLSAQFVWIMATTSNMFMYSLTLQPPTTITQALLGQFSGTKEQQIITASGSRLTLLQPDPKQGRVNTVLSHDIFGINRSIASFRLAGSHKGE